VIIGKEGYLNNAPKPLKNTFEQILSIIKKALKLSINGLKKTSLYIKLIGLISNPNYVSMAYIYHRKIRVQDTDATGVLYFANQLQIGLEAFEEFLNNKNFSLQSMIEEKAFLLPIVHTKADFSHPIVLGDLLSLHLQISHIGTSSFSHSSTLHKEDLLVGTTLITHVVYCPQTKSSKPIPPGLLHLLKSA